MLINKNRPPIEALIYYSLINREQVEVEDVLKRLKEFLQEHSDRTDIWIPFDRRDIMSFCLDHPLRVELVYVENEGMFIKRLQGHRLPVGGSFFNVEDIDRIHGEPWFEDKKLLKAFKKKLM